ncbi:diguanylate cyclase (GGDEF) domain protein [Hoeflea phototrophica DFL-43]|uniref:Diguanylate cyclase (GGDEF) domain protein n=2 Tax=Hoeflea TaxID=274591 RepID=A9DE03_HOEPD|nr:diguanylate cyclase (GGDEF) domain protein [Hoeflea phototrophica DFL-43]
MSILNGNLKSKVMVPIWIVGFFAVLVGGLSLQKFNSMINKGHIEKVRVLVESGVSIAEENHRLFKAGALSEAEAQNRARDAIRAMIFDGGARVFVFNEQGVRVVSNTRADEGTSAWASPHTQSMVKHALEGGGITYYRGARTLNGVTTSKNPKAAWSQSFAPWGWVVASAVYLDDVREAFLSRLIEFAGLFLAGAVILVLVVRCIVRSLTLPLERLTNTIVELANGTRDVRVSDTGLGNEIGDMARAVETLARFETERRELQDQLGQLAYTDQLTGLPNKEALHQTLSKVVQRASARNRECGLIVFDLDRFKTINDTLGDISGDEILKSVATRLKRAVGRRGVVGRKSGDEFFVVIPDLVKSGGLASLVARIRDKVVGPIDVAGTSVEIAISVGHAISPVDTADERCLVRFADMALHQAKNSGGNSVCAYSPDMSEAVETRFSTEAMINDGLRQGEFLPYYQAKVDLASGDVIGAEALCRWKRPETGLVSPTDFIPLAEETGQIVPIGNLMLREACAFAVECNSGRTTPFVVAVNVSPRQLMYGQFLRNLQQSLEETGCEPGWVSLEITESLLITDDGAVMETLNAIAGLGIEIAIDDFGTGYSALGYLTRFPISCLKIDQSFVRRIVDDPQQEILVRAILTMAHGLGMKVVAEGIESQRVADMLHAMKCEIGQGYLWHKPSPAKDFLAGLAKHPLMKIAS